MSSRTEVPFWTSVGQSLRNSSRTEKIFCCVCWTIILGAVAAIVYLLAFRQQESPSNVWNITRAMWLGADIAGDPVKYRPLKLVIINHSVSPECRSLEGCAQSMRNLQNFFLNDKGWDLPYNFVIGNDGRVYEGRGWDREGAHTYGYNSCSLGVGFIGDYRPGFGNTVPTSLQMERFKELMQYGVLMGYLDPEYAVVGASDLQTSASPGDNLLKQMKAGSHYNQDKYRNMTCAQIYDLTK
ncbi:Peptidoglycan-recognition protein SA-like [Plutella xylostella]|uniref:PGRP-S1 n=1 Tax=Plutella xylostella TaxID=51655 RepID=A0A0A7DQF0_PLUXY|nr:Peptidoglycan-recognition protein SA-like [Plutella xylostella]AIW49872.1 PGRP-S1 [Plutella xylostella]